MTEPLVAIFVGGRSSRMGTDKGLLEAPGKEMSLLESLVAAADEAGLEVALVGDARPYASIAVGVPRVDDRPQGAGPLGGLAGAVELASRRGHARIIAVACDMPYVDADVLRMIADHPSDSAILAPRRGDDAPWEPMLARYEVARVASVLDDALRRGTRSFQAFFQDVRVQALPVTDAVRRALEDWDTPSDVPR